MDKNLLVDYNGFPTFPWNLSKFSLMGIRDSDSGSRSVDDEEVTPEGPAPSDEELASLDFDRIANDSNRAPDRIRETVEKVVEEGASSVNDKVNSTVGFDLDRYRKNQEICAPENVRRLTDSPEDLALFEEFYKQLELSESAFHAIDDRRYSDLNGNVKKGCYVGRHTPTDTEQDVMDNLTGEEEDRHVSSGEEMKMFLSGEHPRCKHSDFIAWTHIDPSTGKMAAMTAVFLPPKDEAKMEGHKRQVQEFFSPPESSPAKFNEDHGAQTCHIIDRADTTAEFYMIGSLPEYKGAAVGVYNTMLKQSEVSQRLDSEEITDWHLSRFGGFIQVWPTDREDKRVSREDENEASRAFFKKLGYSRVGQSTNPNNLAARETQGSRVVALNVIWSVAHADAQENKEAAIELMEDLDEKAIEAERIRGTTIDGSVS
ncbi:MAG: hypothetical protein HOG89_00645 [Candidatus Peribacter sp.]|nr:hypothetical protein [Candidatus Peribacter sp.]MBT4392967.1 hypothetical protein [Candidatus Peribacter sp.]MBT4601027.1 hypothetical protein [Candidatus Peribacter sp.]MBT5149611.1 hypothetical protein [Candidatus Peribacter sp.]MBT5637485.1 hypothetical protein [Candidatus Peribacter sp.]